MVKDTTRPKYWLIQQKAYNNMKAYNLEEQTGILCFASKMKVIMRNGEPARGLGIEHDNLQAGWAKEWHE